MPNPFRFLTYSLLPYPNASQQAAVWLLAGFLAVFANVARAEEKNSANAEADNDAIQKALESIQTLVGDWEGDGKSDNTPLWKESLECQWTFKEGVPALRIEFNGEEGKPQPLFSEMTFSYDVKKKQYTMVAVAPNMDEPLEYTGKIDGGSNLLFERVKKGKASDKLDQIDLKILNNGDRIVYNVKRRLGTSKRFLPYAQAGLNRAGTSIAGTSNTPKCIVTGGAGTMTVSYNGASYYVCCSGCREVFLANPEKYIAKLNQSSTK